MKPHRRLTGDDLFLASLLLALRKNPSMLRSLLTGSFVWMLTSATLWSQTLPSTTLKDIEGNAINTTDLIQAEGPTVFCFWATWCSPCKRELNNYAELYEDWVDETGVKIVAVSIDDMRSMNRVAPYVNSVGWEYDILLDPNREFARALNVNNVPHTFVVDENGTVVWSHNNYADGDEYELYEELVKLTK
jgi:peroxiredoxin